MTSESPHLVDCSGDSTTTHKQELCLHPSGSSRCPSVLYDGSEIALDGVRLTEYVDGSTSEDLLPDHPNDHAWLQGYQQPAQNAAAPMYWPTLQFVYWQTMPLNNPRAINAETAQTAPPGLECWGDHDKTTVMIRDLPNNYTRQDLLDLLDSHNFKGHYNFVYLIIDWKRGANVGYAFVNGVTHQDGLNIKEGLRGFQNWRPGCASMKVCASTKVCKTAWASPNQGYAKHVAKYRNNSVMHPDQPDEYKPIIFHNGVRIEFPPPTKPIPKPHPKDCKARQNSSSSSQSSPGDQAYQ